MVGGVAWEQRALWLGFLVSAAVVLYGSCLNSAGLKYSRVSAGYGRDADCGREVMVLSVEESNFCCDGLRSSDWVCVAAYDETNRKLTSSPWAYLAPFIPWLLTATLVEHPYGGLKRSLFYGALLLYRTYILYVAFGLVQRAYTTTTTMITSESSSSDGVNCWYSVHRRNGDCIDHFDFSDHIVFYVTQVLIPSAVELGHVVGLPFTSTSTPPSLSISTSSGRRWKHWLQIMPTIVSSLVLMFLALRAMLFTSLYFHTPYENIMALLVCFLFAVVPTSFILHRNHQPGIRV